MDGIIDGWMDGSHQLVGRVGQLDGQIYGRYDRQLDGWQLQLVGMVGQVVGGMDGWYNRWLDGWQPTIQLEGLDKWIAGWIDDMIDGCIDGSPQLVGIDEWFNG